MTPFDHKEKELSKASKVAKEEAMEMPHIPNIKAEYKGLAYNDVVQFIQRNHEENRNLMLRNR